MSADHRIASPCVRQCCLDDEDMCLGCFRSLQEIKDWALADDARRRAILHRAAERGLAHSSAPSADRARRPALIS